MSLLPRRQPARWSLAAIVCALMTAALAGGLTSKVSESRADAGTVRVTSDTAQCRDASTWAAAQQAPLCSIGRALQLAPSGGRVLVAAGSYPAVSFSSSRSDYVSVAADGSGQVTVPSITLGSGASYVSFSGLMLAGSSGTTAFTVQTGAHHIQLLSSNVTSVGADAVHLLPGTSDMLFQGNHVATTGGGYGIVFAATSTIPGSPAGGHADPPIARVTIRQNTFDGIDGDAVRPANFQDLLVESNEFRNMRENGDHVDAMQSVWGGTNLTFRGNYIHDNNTQGLFLKDGRVTGADIENNIFVRNTVPCSGCGSVQIFLYDVDGAKIINNTVWDNGTNVTIYKNVRNLELRNNLIAYLDTGSASPDGTSTWTEDHNLLGGGNSRLRGPGDLGVARPPQFVDAAHLDYRLKSGSPGIDAGSGVDAPALDKACAARFDAPNVANAGTGSPPYVDLGALEYRPDSTGGDTAALKTGSCGAGMAPGAGTSPGAAPPGAAPAPPGTTTTPPGSTVAPQLVPAVTTICACPRGRRNCRLGRVTYQRRSVVLRIRSRVTCRIRASASASWRGGHARSSTVRRRVAPQRTVSLRIGLPISARRAMSRGRKVTVAVTLVGVSPRGKVSRQIARMTLRR
jgi:hypothetical protein